MNEFSVDAQEELPWQTWQAAEREDFFDSIKKHRLVAWHVSAVCFLAYGLLAFAMSLLLGPLIYCLWGLSLDLINLLYPMPNILPDFFFKEEVSTHVESSGGGILGVFIGFLLILFGGMSLMIWIAYNIAQAIKQGAWLQDSVQAIPFNESSLSLPEQQFSNVLEEMALVAGISAPQVSVVKGGANVAIIGFGDAPALVLVGQDLFKYLNRSQLQGVAAHLISSLIENDGKIGLKITTIMGVVELLARLGISLCDNRQSSERLKLLRAMFRRDVTSRRLLRHYLTEPVVQDYPTAPDKQKYKLQFTWREVLLLPLTGTLIVSSFGVLMISQFILGPFISLIWRQRKYMADASAVKLTREPDGLASALAILQHQNTNLLTTAWTSHFCLVQPGKVERLFLSMFPPLEKRIKALISLGAKPMVLPPDADLKGSIVKLLPYTTYVVVSVMTVLFTPMLVQLCIMATIIFTLPISSLLHSLLRALARAF